MNAYSKPETTFRHWMMRQLDESGIDQQTASDYRLEFLEEDRTRQILRLDKNAKIQPAWIVPYLGKDSSPLTDEQGNMICRVRFKEPCLKTRKRPKGRRYSQLRGQALYPYIPPLVWKMIEDPQMPIIVTEGEKKAIKGTIDGLPVIAFGGVFAWHPKGDRTLQPQFVEILANRTVFFIYDSDYSDNAHMYRDNSEALARELEKIGSTLFEFILPSLADKKTGLDDYLLQRLPVDLCREIAESAVAIESPDHATIPLSILEDTSGLKVFAQLQKKANRGQVTVSRASLAQDTGLSDKKTREAIKRLEKEGVILKPESTKQGTVFRLPKGQRVHEARANDLASKLLTLGQRLQAPRANDSSKGPTNDAEKGQRFSLKTDKKGPTNDAEKGQLVGYGEEKEKSISLSPPLHIAPSCRQVSPEVRNGEELSEKTPKMAVPLDVVLASRELSPDLKNKLVKILHLGLSPEEWRIVLQATRETAGVTE